MPGLHVIGEIVGAAGLRPARDALSAAHVADALSLHPSSTRSFFCRWRLAFRAIDASPQSRKDGPGDGPGNRGGPWSAWRVLQGASRGQTQVHASSAAPTILDQHVTTSSRCHASGRGLRDEEEAQHEAEHTSAGTLVELEALWGHPLDLHLAVGELPPLPTRWPWLVFQVRSLDEFHRERLVGAASTPLPLAQHEFFMDLPLTTRVSRVSAREKLAAWLDLRYDNPEDNDEGEEESDVEYATDDDDSIIAGSAGSLYVRLAVVPQGFRERGVLA